MTTYPEHQQLDLVKIAQAMGKLWQQQKTFEHTIQLRSGQPKFVFYEGPPSANGKPGIHHVLSRTIKDLFCRYKTMQGYHVQRKAGWDTHGLPVELQVEKELGITKQDIGKTISVRAYNAQCKQAVMRYKAQWEVLTERMGYWIDMKNPYMTCDQQYIASLWNLLQRLYNKDLLYKTYSVQPYSPAAGTGLSTHELNQPGCYKSVKDVAITAQFKLQGQVSTYFLAWTTTPWTLPANSALAVNTGIAYVKVQTVHPYHQHPLYVILAEAALPTYFKPEHTISTAITLATQAKSAAQGHLPWRVVERYTGQDLVGLAYKQLLPYVKAAGPAFKVIPADFVTTTEGTGIVHIAPTFGADDWRAAQQQSIAPIMVHDAHGKPQPIVDKQGRFVPAITDFAGCYVKDAYAPPDVLDQPGYKSIDVRLAMKLKQDQKAFRITTHTHSYPHCWRTDKPILYYPLTSWFVRVTSYKKQLIALNKTIAWHPPATGEGRFGHWLEHALDWNLSRSRFWGTPLPIWCTPDGQETLCIGSIDELRQEVQKAVAAGVMKAPLPEDIDLHRPAVDDIVLLSKSGHKMYRESDIVDVWFDSGAMPYAQHHGPFEGQEAFSANYPADLIAEGVDQTRGWFFTLHTLGVMLTGRVAFKRALAHGLVLDKQGNKMSKRLGNTVDPLAIMNRYGPDVLRWYMVKNSLGENLRFDLQELQEVKHKLFGTLHHTYQFFALYANLDGFKASTVTMPTVYTNSDAWILSRLQRMISTVTKAYEAYAPSKVVQAIQSFVGDDLSNWYVRLNRKRFWKSAYDANKVAAYQTLYACLVTVAQLAAPIAPFYMDQVYRDLCPTTDTRKQSVHLVGFPEFDQTWIKVKLEATMQTLQTATSLVHALRKKHHIKVRQPLARVLLVVKNQEQQADLEQLEDLLKQEVNVKAINYVQDTSDKITKQVKPNYSKLGQRYGAQVQAIAQALVRMSPEDIQALEAQGHTYVQLADEQLKILLKEVYITSQDIPGWSVAHDKGVTVALDLTLRPELVEEGLVRELINRLQNLRKEAGMAIQDRIQLTLATASSTLRHAVETYKHHIMQETQALKLLWANDLKTSQTIIIGIDTHELHLNLTKAV